MITQSELKEYLHYTPETGLFVRIKPLSSNSARHVGTIAGCLGNDGYIRIKVNRGVYLAHRLAFIYMVDEYPEEVDHINHTRNDNRWTNLRSANKSLNAKNYTKRKDNTSSFTGVGLHKKTGKWRARININGHLVHLGLFRNKEDAIKARIKYSSENNYHINHGQQKGKYYERY